MAYTNFMDNFRRGPEGGFNEQSWIDASQYYNPQQIKTAIQQLFKNTGPFHVGKDLRSNYMSKAKGYAHGVQQFQGPEGNFGKRSYDQAKAAGFDVRELPTLARQGGMFLPEGAENQWMADMEELEKEDKFGALDFKQGAGVGSNAFGVKTATDPHAGKTGSVQDLKRIKDKNINVSINP